MTHTPAPFSRYEWLLAWRYLRAKRSDGGVSVMTWISLIGIALGVAAMIITLAVRQGFREEIVDVMVGANAHVTVYSSLYVDENGQTSRKIKDYEAQADRIAQVPGVTRVAALVKGQVMATMRSANAGVEVFGISIDNLKTIPRIASPEQSWGDINRFSEGIAIGSGVASTLGAQVGDVISIVSPNGVVTPFGTSPRVNVYEVVYIFRAGRFDIDRTRVYLPFSEAQPFFNREGVADELEVMVENPDDVDELTDMIMQAAGDQSLIWTWRNANSNVIRALDIEDNVMFIILAVLVLVATMNIVSGLIMLVKNKGRDIGILRTIGLSQGAVMRVFFLCGSLTGIVGTVAGVILGVLFVIYIDPIFAVVDYVSGGGVWDPSVRGIYALPASLQLWDVLSAVGLALGLSFIITIFPARRAAAMNPIEALRYE